MYDNQIKSAAMNPGYLGCAQPASAGYETPVRQPEVVAELERLMKAVESVGMVTEALTNRLTPLRNTSGNAIGKEQTSAPEPVLCNMADAIRRERKRLENAYAELQRAMNELEI